MFSWVDELILISEHVSLKFWAVHENNELLCIGRYKATASTKDANKKLANPWKCTWGSWFAPFNYNAACSLSYLLWADSANYAVHSLLASVGGSISLHAGTTQSVTLHS